MNKSINNSVTSIFLLMLTIIAMIFFIYTSTNFINQQNSILRCSQ